MKQKIVGSYYIGSTSAQVVLREGNGAELYLQPEKGAVPRMKLGADVKWWELLDALMHESLEMQFCLLQCRFLESGKVCRDLGSFLFVFTHDQFTEACGRSAAFIDDALADVKKAWQAWHKKPAKKRARRKGKKS